MKLNISESDGKVIAALCGRLDTAASQQFAADMLPLIDNASKTIVLDCSELEFISSSGLRQLLALRKESIAAGGEIIVTHVSEAVKQVFAITGFYSLFTFA